MSKLLVLKREAEFWSVSFFENQKPDAEVVRLFGTHTLPTPFFPSVPFETVRKEIEARNPEHWVTGHPSNRTTI